MIATTTLRIAQAVGREESKMRALAAEVLSRLEGASLVTCQPVPGSNNSRWVSSEGHTVAVEFDRTDGRGRKQKALEVAPVVVMAIIGLTHKEDHRRALGALVV